MHKPSRGLPLGESPYLTTGQQQDQQQIIEPNEAWSLDESPRALIKPTSQGLVGLALNVSIQRTRFSIACQVSFELSSCIGPFG